MFKSDGTRRDFPLVKERVIIGRKVNCDLRIPLTSVSRQHCELTVDRGRVKVRDLGSSNGTYHNSIRVQEADLSAGDELVIGPVVFTLVVDGQPAQIKPVRTIINGQDGATEVASSAPQPSKAKPAKPAKAVASEEIQIPEVIEDAGDQTPTIDLDDDPIAALESLASNDNDDSDEFDDIDFLDLLDDDDDR